ncbi:MAG: cyclase [Deltaproteobacteria bacterium]|nr:cyclase [Deltaproteobacteria bacterium]
MRVRLMATLLMGLAAAGNAAEWEEKFRSEAVAVFARERPGTAVTELKAIGVVDAPPTAVFRLLGDYARYQEIMPYTEESLVVRAEKGGEVVYVYSLVNAPLVSRRDYTLRIANETEWNGGRGFLRIRWTASGEGPAPRKGIVRVKVNDGSWTLEPLDNGLKTRATYLLFTDPEGSLPTWVVNKANSSAIPDIFAALRKHAGELRYSDR